jgi:hypothetical protein
MNQFNFLLQQKKGTKGRFLAKLRARESLSECWKKEKLHKLKKRAKRQKISYHKNENKNPI